MHTRTLVVPFLLVLVSGCVATTNSSSNATNTDPTPAGELAQNPTAPPAKKAADPARPEGPPPTCPNGTKPAAEGLIDDFEAATAPAQGGRKQTWSIATAPHAKVTVPGAKFAANAGGPTGSKQAFHFVGKAAFEDTWGASASVSFLPKGFYDASKYAGIAFKIKSEKPNLNIRLKLADAASDPEGGQCTKDCGNAFGKELILGTDWQEISLMWSELTQAPDWGSPRPPSITPAKIKGMEWAIYPGADFDIWIDEIQFLECK